MISIEQVVLAAALAASSLSAHAQAAPPAARDAGAAQAAQCRERNREQFRKDIALLERYPSEDDLQEARYRALGDEVKRVNDANGRLKDLIANGRGFNREFAFYQPPHRLPENLAKSRDLNRELERLEFERISAAAHEIQRINARYDADLSRYRELVNRTAKAACTAQTD